MNKISGVSLLWSIFVSSGLSAVPGIAAADADGGGPANDTVPPYPGAAPGDLIANLVWVIVSLVIVIVLIVLVIKWLSNRSRQWGANRSMRSLGGVALGQNNSMQVIEIADRIYVVGVGENITLLDKIEDPEQVAAVINALERQPDNGWSSKGLAGLLAKWRERPSAEEQPDGEQWNKPSSFQQMLQSKLNGQADRKQQLESLLQEHKTNERLMDHEK